MNSETQASPTPLPSAQFRRFLLVFHIVFIVGLLFCLVVRWNREGFQWSGQDNLLVLLVIAQVAWYARFFIWPRPPFNRAPWLIVYFVAAYAIWYFERRLEPVLGWVVWAYMGQMFGSLPPRITIPGALLVFLLLVGPTFGWKPPERLHPLDLGGGVAAAVGVIGVGLFLNKLVSTSTDRARLIEELERAQRELEASRSRDAELAVLRERERLARDLHDSLGHSLVTVAVQLEAAQRLVASDPARAASLLGEMRTLTKLSMEQLRRSLAGLRAPGLGDRPLKQALQSACDDARRRSGLEIGCHIDSAADQLPPEVAEALWRGGQEALANVERHARATEASLRLGLKPEAVVLEVRDNGSGLPANADSKPLHYGLRGLRERAEGLGGTLSLKPGEPKGTLLEMRIPLIQPRA